MRCPKCGYISFDHVEFCLKCKKDIKAASDTLQGGVLQVASPVFLNLQPPEDQLDEAELVTEDEEVPGEFDVLGEEEPDEVSEEALILEEEQDEEGENDLIDFEISADEEQESEMAIDSDFFDEDGEIEDKVFDDQLDTVSIEESDDFEIEMPEELLDMSDLAAPDSVGDIKLSDSDSREELNSLDIDLDGFNFELDSDSPDSDELLKPPSGGEEDELSLGDIDFSDTIGGSKGEGGKKTRSKEMDEDLNFDLDLDGLSIHDDI